MEEIISSLREDSEGGGGHTRDSMISSVVFIRDARSGGSVREDLKGGEWGSDGGIVKVCGVTKRTEF